MYLWFCIFFLKKPHKDVFLVPMLCTQRGSYQAQNNYLEPVTVLTPNFETKCINEQLTEESLALLNQEKKWQKPYKNTKNKKKGLTFCSIIKFSILSVEEIAETGELSFQACCPLSVWEHGSQLMSVLNLIFKMWILFHPKMHIILYCILSYRSSKQLLNCWSFQPLLIWVRSELMTCWWKARVRFQSPESFRLPANA